MSGKGFSSAIGASVFGVMAPMLIAGQFLSGYLSGRIPQRYLLAGGQFMMVITIGLLLTATDIWQIYLYGAVMGLNWGVVMNAVVTIWPNYYGRTNLGSIRGVTNFWFMTASALGPLPLALSLDLTGSYTPGLIIYLAIPPMTALAAIFAGIPSVTPSTSISK
jgi:MFS family permease